MSNCGYPKSAVCMVQKIPDNAEMFYVVSSPSFDKTAS